MNTIPQNKTKSTAQPKAETKPAQAGDLCPVCGGTLTRDESDNVFTGWLTCSNEGYDDGFCQYQIKEGADLPVPNLTLTKVAAPEAAHRYIEMTDGSFICISGKTGNHYAPSVEQENCTCEWWLRTGRECSHRRQLREFLAVRAAQEPMTMRKAA